MSIENTINTDMEASIEACMAEIAERSQAEAEAKAWLGAIGALRDEVRLTQEVRERWLRHQSKDGEFMAQVGYLLDQVERVVEMAEGRQP